MIELLDKLTLTQHGAAAAVEMACVDLAARNVLPGLECVGPLKVVDTVATTRLDISTGSMKFPPGPGLGISLDEKTLEQYRPQAH